MSESLKDIGKAIQARREKESKDTASIPAIGRALCNLKGSQYGHFTNEPLWIVIGDTRRALKDTGHIIHRDAPIGGALTQHASGKTTVPVNMRGNYRGENLVELDILNRAFYTPTLKTAIELSINIAGDQRVYTFQKLADLVEAKKDHEGLLSIVKRKFQEATQKRAEAEAAEREAQERIAREKAQKQLEAERRQKEEEIRKQEEEEKRLREEVLRKAEEERKAQAEVDRLEQEIAEDEERIKITQSFIRKDVNLRSQHILDPAQDQAKRSHLYDGIPLVIEGGPGTGKTTTMIQRLKFLISPIALQSYESPLSKAQIETLTDPNTIDLHWLYFSPTDKLLAFLRQNMQAEYLHATEDNTTTLEKFLSQMLLAYKLRNPETDGPFRLHREKVRSVLIRDAQKAIGAFEQFCIQNITNILLSASRLETSQFPWHEQALGIKAYCRRAENIKDIDALMRLFNALHDNERKGVAAIEQQLGELIKRTALNVKELVFSNEVHKDEARALFERWRQETIVTREDYVVENEMDQGEDEEEEPSMLDFEPKLFQQVKGIIKSLALKQYDPKQKLSKRQEELYTIIKDEVSTQNLAQIGSLAWFTKNYAFLCRGLESNILNQLPRLYKLFRKHLVESRSQIYDVNLLESLIKRDGGKRIHADELELLIGFINNMLLGIYKKSKQRFEGMRNKYLQAYRDNARYVIGVDEATDFSLIDYYFMASFRHWEFSAITLCGDLMQGLNSNGITSWRQLDSDGFLPKVEVITLKTSYRQLPTLLDMSKRMYFDDRREEAPYDTEKERSNNEAAPLCFVSDDEEEKARWIAERIIEIYKEYDSNMPSVAIFVGDEVNISDLVDLINDQDYLNGIHVYDCSENRITSDTKAVRIFRLNEVKGMEFEIVFFYDIDKALEGQSDKLLRRYLYVGISRATTHLAALFCKEQGNEQILSYFDRTKKNWRL